MVDIILILFFSLILFYRRPLSSYMETQWRKAGFDVPDGYQHNMALVFGICGLIASIVKSANDLGFFNTYIWSKIAETINIDNEIRPFLKYLVGPLSLGCGIYVFLNFQHNKKSFSAFFSRIGLVSENANMVPFMIVGGVWLVLVGLALLLYL